MLSWLLRGFAALLPLLLLSAPAHAIVLAPFGPNGTYVRPSGQPSTFQIGAGGFVEELQAFVRVDESPAAVRLGTSAVPAGLALSFQATLSGDGTDLLLSYEFTRTDATPLASLTFVSFLDAEIDEAINTFFNEYGEVEGTPAAIQGWEIDEPGYAFGDVYDNAFAALLDGQNGVPVGAPDDVSMALSFAVGPLAPGQAARFELLISEDGDALGGFLLRQRDAAIGSPTTITFSGRAAIVPEPATAVLVALGIAGLARTRPGRS